MKRTLFVGLGNPGSQYTHTRHNAGWVVLDELAKLWSDPAVKPVWKREKKIESEVLHLSHSGQEIIFIKPQTFMNESGRAVASALRWYLNIDPDSDQGDYRSLVIFHDDLDLTTGQYKLQFDSGPKIHNGLNSVRDRLGTNRFWCARFGVDSRGGQRTVPGQAYVLQPMSAAERTSLLQTAQTIAEELPYTVLQ